MTTDGQRAARAAFDAARASFDRLTRAGDPAESSAALIDAWAGTEQALRALAGTDALRGVAVVRELRQRNLLALDDAHAFVDLQAAAERSGAGGYVPSEGDIAAAAAARERMTHVLSRDIGAPYGDPSRSSYADPAGPSYARPEPTSSPSRPVLEPLPPPAPLPPSATSNRLALVVVILAVAALAAAGGYYARLFSREPGALRQGRAAFAAGDRLSAKNAFAMAAAEQPMLAEPQIYLGRIAREEGNRAAASAALRRAVELEPDNYLAHRELAALLLSTGQPELARSFYQRAIELNPADKVSLGYMGCTLLRLGRGDLAVRFLQRAGAGEWQACQAMPPAIPPGMAPPGATILPPPPR